MARERQSSNDWRSRYGIHHPPHEAGAPPALPRVVAWAAELLLTHFSTAPAAPAAPTAPANPPTHQPTINPAPPAAPPQHLHRIRRVCREWRALHREKFMRLRQLNRPMTMTREDVALNGDKSKPFTLGLKASLDVPLRCRRECVVNTSYMTRSDTAHVVGVAGTFTLTVYPRRPGTSEVSCNASLDYTPFEAFEGHADGEGLPATSSLAPPPAAPAPLLPPLECQGCMWSATSGRVPTLYSSCPTLKVIIEKNEILVLTSTFSKFLYNFLIQYLIQYFILKE